MAADFGEAGFHVVIFLGVVVAGNPPGGMVARHGKLCMLFLDDKIDQVLLYGKLIPQADALVVNTEPDVHLPVGLGL